MSSEKTVDTTYNTSQLVMLVTVAVISIIVVIGVIVVSQKINEAQNEITRFTSRGTVDINITPLPTKVVTPTPRSPTPTAAPTLKPEEKKEILNTFTESIESEGLEIPPEALDEIKQVTGS